MDKGIRGLLVLLQKPYRLCFVLAGLFLFFSGTMFHSSIIVKDYMETTGEVCNLEETTEIRQGVKEPRYNYDLIWYEDGEKYEKHFHKQIDTIEEGEITIWVRPDNEDAVFSNSVEMNENAYNFLAYALIAGLIGLLLYGFAVMNRRESRSQTIERLENAKLYSILVFILCLIGIVIQVVMEYPAYKNGEYINPVIFDFSIACGVIAAGCLIMFFCARRKLKRYE